MLLSIIIPTKNRQHTALYAVESALAINEDDFEVIIHDCSDTAILQEQVRQKFGNDPRIKYFFTDSKPSMTENWNLAFSKASGDYCCGIGDDDAVLTEIYSIAKWAKQNQVAALVHSIPYNYTWPGFYLQPHDGTFYIKKNFSGNFLLKNDYEERVKKYGMMTDITACFSLPAIYHSLISTKLKEQLVQDTGKMLDSTALDIYTAIAFSKYISDYVYVDYPFSLKGASAASNSQRVYTGKTKDHFSEFKDLRLPDILPNTTTLYTAAAEAYILASQNTHRDELVKLIDLPMLYAHVAIEESGSYQECLEKLHKYAPGKKNKFRFYKVFYKEKIRNKRNALAVTAKQKMPFVQKIYRKLFPYKGAAKTFQATTIMEGLDIHKKFIADNSIHLHFPTNKELN